MKIDKLDLSDNQFYQAIQQIQPKQYRFKSDPSILRYGLLADDLELIPATQNLVSRERNLIPFETNIVSAQIISETPNIESTSESRLRSSTSTESSRIFEYKVSSSNPESSESHLVIGDQILVRKNQKEGNTLVIVKEWIYF